MADSAHRINIPFHRPAITEKEINAVAEAMRSGWLTTGPKTVEFEEAFSKYVFGKADRGLSIAVNSATAALHLALEAVGVKQGDEVILPTLTFVATAEVITYLGARPVLCDTDIQTHNIDTARIEHLITQKTKAIIPVHFGGQPCDMGEILRVAKKHNLFVVEDAAHALTSVYKGMPVGTIGDITCFSFYATKPLCTGEGGMSTTFNKDFAERMRRNRLHGICKKQGMEKWKKNWYYDVVDAGHKYNMPDINAAIGIAQLASIERMTGKREEIAHKYDNAFKGTSVETLAMKNGRSSRHLYTIKVNNRDELMRKLCEKGIEVSMHFIPIHKFSYYRKKYGYNDADYPAANLACEKSLSLPIYPDLTDAEVSFIAKNVLRYAE